MMRCEEQILEFPLEKQPCWVGFSGGADSTALLLLLHTAGWDVRAVHFHHHLRGKDADDDATWCRQFCEQRAIPFIQRDLDVNGERERGESTESAARRLRLSAWQALCDTAPMPIFLAHHADDALEELFLRLGRGANLSGLVGLRPVRHLANGLTLCRPLLSCRKSELEAFLRSHGITDWRTDKTNFDNICRRNMIRNELLPLLRKIFDTDAGFLQSLRVMTDDAEFIENAAQHCEPQSLSDWQELPPALFPRVLRRRFDLPLSPSAATIERFRDSINNYTGGNVTVPLGGAQWLNISFDGLKLSAEAHDSTTHYILFWRWRENATLELPNGGCLSANADDDVLTLVYQYAEESSSEKFAITTMPDELLVRTWQDGDTMTPFGMTGHSSLKKLFNAKKIYGTARLKHPVLCVNEEIIWVPGVRRGEWGRIT